MHFLWKLAVFYFVLLKLFVEEIVVLQFFNEHLDECLQDKHRVASLGSLVSLVNGSQLVCLHIQ